MGPVEVVRTVIQQTLNLAFVPTHHEITMEPIPNQNAYYLGQQFSQPLSSRDFCCCPMKSFEKGWRHPSMPLDSVKHEKGKKLDNVHFTPYSRWMSKPMRLQPQSVHVSRKFPQRRVLAVCMGVTEGKHWTWNSQPGRRHGPCGSMNHGPSHSSKRERSLQIWSCENNMFHATMLRNKVHYQP